METHLRWRYLQKEKINMTCFDYCMCVFAQQCLNAEILINNQILASKTLRAEFAVCVFARKCMQINAKIIIIQACMIYRFSGEING